MTNNKLTLKKVFYYFLASRTLFILFALIASYVIPLNLGYLGRLSDPNSPYLTWIWANFDGNHFLEIASIGYRRFNFVYFPLYPFIVRLVSSFLHITPLYSGLLVSNVAFILAIWVFGKLVALDLGAKKVNLALWILILFPTSFYYNAVYSTSFQFLFSALCFLAARRKKWLLAGMFGLLVTANHLTGLAILPAIATEWYWQNKKSVKNVTLFVGIFFRKGLLMLLIACLGILSYMAYLWIFHSDPLLFMKSFAGWHTRTSLVFPLRAIFRYSKIFWTVDKHLLVYWIAVLEFTFMLVYCWLSIYVLKKIRLSYAIYMISIILISAMSGSFIGIPRYVLFFFPGIMAITQLIANKKNLKVAYFFISIVLGFILTALFTRGYFVG